MNELDVNSNIYVYPLNKNFLRVPEVNPCMNSFQDQSSVGIAWLDDTEYSYEFTFPATREFLVDSSLTCDENTPANIIVFNNNGDTIDCDTEPFKWCNGNLSFQSSDLVWEGTHEFSAVGFTWTVLQPGDEYVEEEEEEAEEDSAISML